MQSFQALVEMVPQVKRVLRGYDDPLGGEMSKILGIEYWMALMLTDEARFEGLQPMTATRISNRVADLLVGPARMAPTADTL
jgi:hypothetical protein